MVLAIKVLSFQVLESILEDERDLVIRNGSRIRG